MAKAPKESQTKPDMIISKAVEILQNEGDAGLTMRQVAVKANMSLSNLQYYFKDKTTLLTALTEHYFDQCIDLLMEYKLEVNLAKREEQIKAFILFFLDHVEELSEMCRVFRELWAISTRNKNVEKHLNNYYKN